jgi:alcohol dehydrogenase class IV
VLGSPEHRVKVSLRSPHLLARNALVDPELTLGLPRALTATTGMDALTQLVEPFVSCRANPMSDGVCREGLGRVARSLRRACECGADPDAREDMALASLFGGLALANAGLGAVHGFAGPLGGMFDAPHGAICARLLPIVMEVNHRAAKERDLAGETTARFDEVARILTGSATARASDGVVWVRELTEALKIEGLSTYGVGVGHIQEVVEKASKASSMKANPMVLSQTELAEILERAL